MRVILDERVTADYTHEFPAGAKIEWKDGLGRLMVCIITDTGTWMFNAEFVVAIVPGGSDASSV